MIRHRGPLLAIGRLGLGDAETKLIPSPFTDLDERHLVLLTDYLLAPRGHLTPLGVRLLAHKGTTRPALVSPGVTIMVSHLIALMRDQVDNLRTNGVQKVAAIYSGISQTEQ